MTNNVLILKVRQDQYFLFSFQTHVCNPQINIYHREVVTREVQFTRHTFTCAPLSIWPRLVEATLNEFWHYRLLPTHNIVGVEALTSRECVLLCPPSTSLAVGRWLQLSLCNRQLNGRRTDDLFSGVSARPSSVRQCPLTTTTVWGGFFFVFVLVPNLLNLWNFALFYSLLLECHEIVLVCKMCSSDTVLFISLIFYFM